MSYTYKKLHEMSDDEIIEEYDKQATNTNVGINYYADELNRRSMEKSNKIMVKCTIAITIMTAVMLIATIANVIIAII